ncbi:MAG TPA: YbiU family protein [Vicinamibacteria bacterium]
MTSDHDDLRTTIRATKQRLRRGIPDLPRSFAEVEEHLRREVDAIQEACAQRRSPLPSIDFADVARGAPGEAAARDVRRRGVAIVRRVFSREQAAAWDDAIGEYLASNRYQQRPADAELDQYFSALDSGRPQIFGIYWSKPQVEARQHQALAGTRAFLNSLWTHASDGRVHFRPDRECTYADRIRRREPGDRSLGLSPHMDAGSVERWIDPAYQKVYRHVFTGDAGAYNPFDGAFRAETQEIPSPAVCSMFRTWQGWTALTPQGEGDGTLQLVPIARAIVYLLLRPLLPDVPEDGLCGAEPGRALCVTPEWHSLLLPALVSIPRLEPGDTVWWHPDVIHGLESVHAGSGYSNVAYIGSAPECAKNLAYLERQKAAFLAGESAPDFAPEHYETGFAGRAGIDDLSPLGRRQMGFDAW